jgi:archaellum component FlaF (FlaF/FlaG flagellin family)
MKNISQIIFTILFVFLFIGLGILFYSWSETNKEVAELKRIIEQTNLDMTVTHIEKVKEEYLGMPGIVTMRVYQEPLNIYAMDEKINNISDILKGKKQINHIKLETGIIKDWNITSTMIYIPKD